MIKVTVKGENIREQVEAQVEEQVENVLMKVAFKLASVSPVDTGAFASSWAVNSTRSVSSRGRPRGQDTSTYRQVAFGNMVNDIYKLDLMNTASFIFRNAAPHANKVDSRYAISAQAGDIVR